MSLTRKAVVLLSGGLDSTLTIAKAEGIAPCALSFRYGQRHSTELDVAAMGVAEQVIANVDLGRFSGSALTSDTAVPRGCAQKGAEGSSFKCSGSFLQHGQKCGWRDPGSMMGTLWDYWTELALPVFESLRLPEWNYSGLSSHTALPWQPAQCGSCDHSPSRPTILGQGKLIVSIFAEVTAGLKKRATPSKPLID